MVTGMLSCFPLLAPPGAVPISGTLGNLVQSLCAILLTSGGSLGWSPASESWPIEAISSYSSVPAQCSCSLPRANIFCGSTPRIWGVLATASPLLAFGRSLRCAASSRRQVPLGPLTNVTWAAALPSRLGCFQTCPPLCRCIWVGLPLVLPESMQAH